MTNFYW